MTDLDVRSERDRAGSQLTVSPVVGQLATPRGKPLRDLWDEHAIEWITWVRAPGHPDSYWRFHRKHFLSLVPVPGRLTLDIGCGEGRVGRDLQEAGHRVVGIDWSLTMCKAAATYPDERARFIAGDAAQLPLADGSADCVIAFMSLQDIDDMPGAIDEMARVLEDGKKLALAIVHPMYSYSSGRLSAANVSASDPVITRSYFQPELCVSQDGQDGLTVTFFREHRPLESYVQTLITAGFSIEELHEVTEEDQDDPRHRIPMFLDVLAIRRPREKKSAEVEIEAEPEEKAAPAPRLKKFRFVLTMSTGILVGVGAVVTVVAIAFFAPH